MFSKVYGPCPVLTKVNVGSGPIDALKLTTATDVELFTFSHLNNGCLQTLDYPFPEYDGPSIVLAVLALKSTKKAKNNVFIV